jgi:hypothetical protein
MVADVLAALTAERERHALELAEERTRFARELDSARTRIAELERAQHHWWDLANSNAVLLAALYRSRSWRLTAPIRSFSAFWGRARDRLVRLLRRRPKPASVARPGPSNTAAATPLSASVDPRDRLSARERQVCTDLKAAIRRQRLS